MPKPLLKRSLVAVPTRRVARAQPGRWRRPALDRGASPRWGGRRGAPAGSRGVGRGWRSRGGLEGKNRRDDPPGGGDLRAMSTVPALGVPAGVAL